MARRAGVAGRRRGAAFGQGRGVMPDEGIVAERDTRTGPGEAVLRAGVVAHATTAATTATAAALGLAIGAVGVFVFIRRVAHHHPVGSACPALRLFWCLQRAVLAAGAQTAGAALGSVLGQNRPVCGRQFGHGKRHGP